VYLQETHTLGPSDKPLLFVLLSLQQTSRGFPEMSEWLQLEQPNPTRSRVYLKCQRNSRPAVTHHLCTVTHPSLRILSCASNIRTPNPSPCFHTHAHYFLYPSSPLSLELSIKLHMEYWNLKPFPLVAVGNFVSKCSESEHYKRQWFCLDPTRRHRKLLFCD